MSAMVNLEVPWINVMTKMDLITPGKTKGKNGMRSRRDISRYMNMLSIHRSTNERSNRVRYLDPDPHLLSDDPTKAESNLKFHALNQAIVGLVSDVSSCSTENQLNRGHLD